jgi:CheY-like chemotaxis protein
LVAEDDAVNRMVIEQWLGRAGISVQGVASGLAALEQFAGGALDCELVFMDVQMPGLDGLAATRRLRASGQTLPIVGLSAGASAAEQQACLDAGMSDFLAKPLDLDELWGCLTRWLPPFDEQANAPTESVESRFLNDQNALAQARAAFRSSHHHDGQRLADLLRSGHIGAAARLAHQLRGSAATLGLNHLAALARALEQDLAGEAELPLLSARCADIHSELELACARFG